MSIEDINYLKENSIKQSYTFLVDSKMRDRRIYPNPSHYVVDFTVPFKNVVGIEVVDVSIPKTMCNIDINNNRLYYYLGSRVEVVKDKDGKFTYDATIFSHVELPIGDYTTNTFIDKFRQILRAKNIDLDVVAVDTPADLTNRIYFRSTQPFILDMNQSTIAETIGFDLYTSSDETDKYQYVNEYNKLEGFEKLYHSRILKTGLSTIYAPGMMYLLGNKYVLLRCAEIEQHAYRSLSYTKYNLGLAKMRVNNYGYNDEKTSFLKVPIREFHPIGKFSRMTLRFETDDGTLYDFKGVNHNIVFAIYYYEPKQINVVTNSILNPDYKSNFLDYMYKQDDQEGESDDDEDAEDFSRDNIDIYKRHELEYNKLGIDNINRKFAIQNKKEYEQKQMQEILLKQRVIQAREDSNESNESNDSNDSDDSNESNDSNDSE
jgi:hypothetical protein